MEGTVLGHYRLIRLIGEGGMGSVYLARDEQLEREVAVKVIAPELARNPHLMARFRVEARAQAKLSHPHIVTIHAFEQSGDTHYFVMEYVPGTTLRELISLEGPLPLPQVINLMLQVLDAVACAHGSGVIHRDIKPSNVFVTPQRRVKIGDFGIAKVAGLDGLTRVGTGMGSPLYSAPEQLLGQKTDARTDIFALGMTLFELLTASPPVQVGEGVWALPAPTSLRPELPSEVDRVVLGAVARNPSGRYPDVTAFRQALMTLFPTQTALMVPPGGRDWPWRSGDARRRRVLGLRVAGALSLCLLFLLAWVVLSTGQEVSLVGTQERQGDPGPGALATRAGGVSVPGEPKPSAPLQPGLTAPEKPVLGGSSPPVSSPGAGGVGERPLAPGPVSPDDAVASGEGRRGGAVPGKVDRVAALNREGRFGEAVAKGRPLWGRGAPVRLAQELAFALHALGDEREARRFARAALAGGGMAFPVTWRVSRRLQVAGRLALDESGIRFQSAAQGGRHFSLAWPELLGVVENLGTNISDLFRKKKNRRNPVLIFRSRQKERFSLELGRNDPHLSRFLRWLVREMEGRS